MNWEQIVATRYNRGAPRSWDVNFDYQLHRKITEEFFSNFSEYIAIKYTDCFERYMIEPNRFPYNIDFRNNPDIRHYVFWVNPKYKTSLEEAKRICEKEFSNCEVFLYENPIKYQSIPGVVHYQVFIKTTSL